MQAEGSAAQSVSTVDAGDLMLELDDIEEEDLSELFKYHPARIVCTNCGAVLGARDATCTECGADVRSGEAVVKVEEEPGRWQKRKKAFVVAIVVLVCMIGLATAGVVLLTLD